MSKHVGFTGTRVGMDESQRAALARLLLSIEPTYFHHGDCSGADEQAHAIVRQTLPAAAIVIHPSNGRLRAYCAGDQTRIAKPPLDRNSDIVEESRIVIATPKEQNETLRSGTWATIRRARKAGRELHILYPEG